MGVKQLPSDQNSDPKKRRRVGFSSIDAGVVAEECVKIYLVSSKEEVDASDSFCIDPLDLNQFFEEDGKIYGYQELKGWKCYTSSASIHDCRDLLKKLGVTKIKHAYREANKVADAMARMGNDLPMEDNFITVWVSSISFHAYADITYQSTSDGGKGITDLKSALQRIFAETLVEMKDEFLQTFSTESHYIRSILSSGEILQYKPSNCHGSDFNNHVEAETSDVEAIRMVISNVNAGHFYSRLVPLVLLLVDGSSPIDITDSRWEIYILVQKKIDEQGDSQYRLLGFTAVYRFYHYPDTSRLRLSQILVLPLYQNKGYGRRLLDLLKDVAIAENVYDVTVEEPLEYFQQVRTCVDTSSLLHLDSVQHAVDSVVTRLKQERLSKKSHSSTFMPPLAIVEDARRSLKINKKQFLQCWEVLIYLGLDPVEKYMENFVTLISDHVRADILGKDSGTAGKQVIEVPSDYDPEASFVMFRSQAGDVSSIQIDENQNNQEEQLKQLVDERVKEIKLIAQKVSLHRA